MVWEYSGVFSQEMPVLPFILAPAALVALPPTAATPAALVEGLVRTQAGKPLPASVGLIPMARRDEPFPARTVENLTVKTKKAAPGFRLPIPVPGLYLLDVRGRGCRPLQVPVLLGAEGLKDLELAPLPEKTQGEAKPVSPDPRIAKLASLYAAQKDREAAYLKAVKLRMAQKKNATSASGTPVDWSADLASLASDLKSETDPDVLALAAVCYLELHTMMAEADPEVARLALDQLPAESPWWALNTRAARGAFAAADRSEAWASFIDTLSKDNPDREVRAYGLYSQAASAYRKGDRATFDSLVKALASGYKDTKYGKSVKVFNPAKMPPPSEANAPGEDPGAPAQP